MYNIFASSYNTTTCYNESFWNINTHSKLMRYSSQCHVHQIPGLCGEETLGNVWHPSITFMNL